MMLLYSLPISIASATAIIVLKFILNNCLDWLVAEKEIATYVENKKSKPFYKKIPLLSFIYPVHIPTNLVKETLVIDGKVKSVKKISRQMELV